MTGSKEIMSELNTNINLASVTYGDKSTSKVLGLGKVVVTPDIKLVDVMLVETLGYNLMSVRALSFMGFSVFFHRDSVILLWSKSLNVAFVVHVEHNLYVVDFSGVHTTDAMCLFGKADVGGDRKSTRLNSSHITRSRMPSSA